MLSKRDVKSIGVVVGLGLFLFCLVGLAWHGILSRYVREKRDMENFRISQIEHLKEVVSELKVEVTTLKTYCRWELVLTDILSKQSIAEMDVLEEMVKQRIQNDFNSKRGK